MTQLLTKIRRKKIHKGLLLYRLFQKLPVQANLVLFESFLGRGYSDNPKALYLKLQKQRPELQLVWIFAKEPKQKSRRLVRTGYCGIARNTIT